jgi:2-amino-4-hydroxy-6-hydroxymethyldihydropteridine diphosphokinase
LRLADLWRPVYVSIGSNLGDPVVQVHTAFARLERIAATQLVARSRLYRSAPLDGAAQPDYVNAVAGLVSQLEPLAVLQELLAIETGMGRVRREKWGPRIIDLDLLWMVGAHSSTAELQLPHPGISSRNFVLYPLAEIAPALEIPGLGSVTELKSRVSRGAIEILE